MKVLFGGFGIQGFLAVPFLDALDEVDFGGEMIVNGLGGFYAILKEKLGRAEALSRLKSFVRKFWEELYMADREWLCSGRRKRGYKPLAVKYCYLWAVKESMRSWKEMEDLLEGLEGDSEIGVEYFDIDERSVGVYRGSAKKAAMISAALLEIFPPVDGRYLSTTYLSQIPILSAEDGDVVLVNLRDPSRCDVKKADEILAQSAELRAIALAKKLILKKRLKTIHASPISWSDISRIESFKEIFKKELEGIL